MKKVLILAGILALTMSSQVFAADTATQTAATDEQKIEKPCNKMQHPPKNRKSIEFEKRLKLTDTQKEQAKQIHQKGFEEIKPVMEKIELKKEEINAVKRSKLAPEAQAEQIVQLRKEIRALKKEARDIQIKNMKEFESILTDKQLKELKKMKEEGRKQFEKNHKKQFMKMPPKGPDFQGPKPVFE